jgi:hypothetical protein
MDRLDIVDRRINRWMDGSIGWNGWIDRCTVVSMCLFVVDLTTL